MKNTVFFFAIATAIFLTSCGNPNPPQVESAGINQQTNPTGLEYQVRLQGPFLDHVMVPGILESAGNIIWVTFPDAMYKDAVMLNQHLIAGDTVYVTVKMMRRHWWNDWFFIVTSAEVVQKQPEQPVQEAPSNIIGEITEEKPVKKKQQHGGSNRNEQVVAPTPGSPKKDCGCSVVVTNSGVMNAPIIVTIGNEHPYLQEQPIVVPQEIDTTKIPTIVF